MARVSTHGLTALDKRSAGYRALAEWRAGLERDLGGRDALSEQQRTLVELACRTKLFLDSLDVYLMGLPSLVNKRRRAVLPALTQRMQLQESLARMLDRLGIQKQEAPPPSLEAYLESEEFQRSRNAPIESEPDRDPPADEHHGANSEATTEHP